MIGENIMLINEDEMKRAIEFYIAKILNDNELKTINVFSVRKRKMSNKKYMYEIKLTEKPSAVVKEIDKIEKELSTR